MELRVAGLSDHFSFPRIRIIAEKVGSRLKPQISDQRRLLTRLMADFVRYVDRTFVIKGLFVKLKYSGMNGLYYGDLQILQLLSCKFRPLILSYFVGVPLSDKFIAG